MGNQNLSPKAAGIIALLIVGILAIAASWADAMIVLKNKNLTVGKAEMKDFHDTAIVEGDVFFVQGPFASYEQRTKRFGVPVGKKKTYYYFILNVSRDDFLDMAYNGNMDAYYSAFYFVYATSDEDQIKKANAAVEDSEDYFKRVLKGDATNPPGDNLHISGKLCKQPDDSKYKSHRDSTLACGGIDSTRVGDYMVLEGKPSVASVAILIAGALMCLASVVIAVILVIKNKRENSAELYY